MDRSRSHHDAHDLQLVAALATDDVSDAERDRATAQLASCDECTLLLADIRAIASATAALPDTRRPRDFRIDAATAERLRGRPWRGIVGFLLNPRGAGRPLATALSALGIAGLLVSGIGQVVPSLGSAGAAAPSVVSERSAADQSASGAEGDAAAPVPAASAAARPSAAFGSMSTPASGSLAPQPDGASASALAAGGPVGASVSPQAAFGGPKSAASNAPPSASLTQGTRDAAGHGDAGPGALVVGSIAILALGLLLFAVRRVAGRRTPARGSRA